jgi:hypothetical protein
VGRRRQRPRVREEQQGDGHPSRGHDAAGKAGRFRNRRDLVSGNASAQSAAVTATTLASIDTTGPTAPGNLHAFDFGCETWLFWNESVDDVDPPEAILYEVRVNGVFDGAGLAIDRWITYGTQASNTYSVQAVDSAGNRSASSSTLDNQTC